jgi:pimeloyl-ACP methyl ester carboxylesterase
MSSNDVSVVLVHGAWADGSSWAKVIAPLAADGFKVVAAPLPLTSFRDDVADRGRAEQGAGQHADQGSFFFASDR